MSDQERSDEQAIHESRREVEMRLLDLKESIGRELGFLPKAKYALLSLVAASAGMALASRRRKKTRGKKLGR